MRTQRQLSVILLSTAALVAWGCQEEVVKAPPVAPKVTVSHPEVRELMEYDQYNGWIDATATVEVRARVRGHIEKVDFTDGEIVKKDQALFELDPRPFQANVDRAKEQLKVYQAQATAAQKEEARLKELLSKGGASQSQVDKAEADRISLEAQIESAKQEIKRQELELEYSKITAPITGRISRAEMTAGNLVNAGGSDPLLTTIVAVDPMDIYFAVDERSMQRYMKMRPVAPNTTRSGDVRDSKLTFQFGLETDAGFPHSGQLDFVDNKVDRTTGTILARGVVANPQGIFVAGARVKIRIPVSEARSTTLVPDTAVLSDQDKKYVLVVDDKNVVQRRDIAPGRLLDDGMRVVLAGDKGPAIGPNEWLVTQGIQMARINYPVEPVKPSSTQPAGAAANP